MQPSEPIENGRLPPEEHCVTPHDDIVPIGLDVLMYADEVRQMLSQQSNKFLCTRQLFGRCDDHRHKVAILPDTPNDVTQDALMCVLIVDRNAKLRDNSAYGIGKRIIRLTLNMTVLRIDDRMASLRETANDDFPLSEADGKLHFIAIVPR